ncbi:hypothetical protein FRC03_007325 [Tulasnella sp. 419]|nr:hypothetical protein FRC02_006403 [Tulasnella sp. 418]KAG8938364.1 hypothetical protein FRC03_007325 [Tulasnella sp. 419]
MPLFLTKKRAHSQLSDDESDHYHTASSSSIATPYTSRMRSDDDFDTRKRKLPRYSLPTESPNNIFRIGNDERFAKLNAPKVLPHGVKTYLELRFQLQHSNVFRLVQVPTSYTFRHLSSLMCFLFGWESHYAPEWRLVKDTVLYSQGPEAGQIKSSRPWKELRPLKSDDKEACKDLSNPFLESQKKVEDEKNWTIAKVWGQGAIFTQRAAIFNYNLGTPCAVEITVSKAVSMPKASNQPVIIRSKGAPLTEDEAAEYTQPGKKNFKDKEFYKEDFNGEAFEQYLNGEVKVFLGRKELVLCTPREYMAKVKEERALIARELRKAAEEREGSDEE